MKFMRTISFTLLAACAFAPRGAAQVPSYRTEFLGETGSGGSAVDLNDAGVVAGVMVIAGNQRAFVVASGLPLTLLPLPAGRNSSWATKINEQGVVIGAVGSSFSPEFAGRAAVWIPDASGGHVVQELGALPGSSASNATALNDVGDVLGWSNIGMFRIPTLFTLGGAPISLQATGVFDPVAVNDSRVVVDRSADAKLLDLNTMSVTSLGVPTGLPIHYNAVRATCINASGQVGAVAILATSGSCVQQSARFTNGVGWEVLGPCGSASGIADLNDLGELSMVWGTSTVVQLNQHGVQLVADLLSAPVGSWSFPIFSAFRINDAHQLAGWAYNSATNQAGIVLLTPDSGAGSQFCAGDGSVGVTPCPCGNTSTAGSGRGCSNSLGEGALLVANGSASLSADVLVLAGSGMPNSSTLYFQGTTQVASGAGSVFGDGLRCAGGTVIRLGTKTNVGGASQYPSAGEASISVRGLVTTPGARTYQAWYRNAAAYCTSATFNLTNGWSVVWTA